MMSGDNQGGPGSALSKAALEKAVVFFQSEMGRRFFLTADWSLPSFKFGFKFGESLGSYPGETYMTGDFTVGVRLVSLKMEGQPWEGRGMWSGENYNLFNPPVVEDLGKSAGYYAMCCPPYKGEFCTHSARLVVAPRGKTAYHEKGFRSASYEVLALLATYHTPYLWLMDALQIHSIPILTDIRQAAEWGLPILPFSVGAMTPWSWSSHRRVLASQDAPR